MKTNPRGSEIMNLLKNSNSPLAKELENNKPIDILWGEYQLTDLIGSGSFGKVYTCIHKETGKVFACKKFKNTY